MKRIKLKVNYVYINHFFDLDPLDLKNNSGGTIGNKKVQIKLDVEERIIWNNLNGQISNVLEKTNSEFKKNNIKEISLNSLINTLHLFWRRGRIDFSYK